MLVVGHGHALVGREGAAAGVDAVLLQRPVVRVAAGHRLGAVLVGLVALGDRAAGRVEVRRFGGLALGGVLHLAADGVFGALAGVVRYGGDQRLGGVDLGLQPL